MNIHLLGKRGSLPEAIDTVVVSGSKPPRVICAENISGCTHVISVCHAHKLVCQYHCVYICVFHIKIDE